MISKEVSSTIFKVFGMNQPGIEPWSPRLFPDTLPTRPMSRPINFSINNTEITEYITETNFSFKESLLPRRENSGSELKPFNEDNILDTAVQSQVDLYQRRFKNCTWYLFA